MENQPLTDEQIWGVPFSEFQAEAPSDFCPLKKVRCTAWDSGCQAAKCVYKTE